MTLPKNIKGEHLKLAIEKIDIEGIPGDGDSQYYDVLFDGKRYPPKLIVSYANIYANGKELNRSSFRGGLGTDCFKLLEQYGYMILPKSKNIKSIPKVWIEKTLVKNRLDRIQGDRALGKALWSPQRDRRGADIYKNMEKVEEGDLILHLTDNKEFSGVSIVKNKAIKTNGISGTHWDGPSFLIELEDYVELDSKIGRNELLNNANRKRLEVISSDSEVFYNGNLTLRQGAYLTPCPDELAALINQIYKNKKQTPLPHFENRDYAEMNKKNEQRFDIVYFKNNLNDSGLVYSNQLIIRLISSLISKPFVILTGLSGSGKTKLAQAFVQWICQENSQYRIIPVGADWTNREPLLGYPNALKPEEYVKPDNGVLDLIVQANKKPQLPHFLILDEMNLSHVERYFADFLSAMESMEEIPLFADGIHNELQGVPARLSLPSNLFIIGTVNIDETTNMFSPKVLDRANTIEFRVTQSEMEGFLSSVKGIDMNMLKTKGASMAGSFLQLAENKSFVESDRENIDNTLLRFFGELKKTGAEFGYRGAVEILRLINQLGLVDEKLTINEKVDIAIMQKLLPKLHGSRRKLCPILLTLGSFCIDSELKMEKEVFEKEDFDFNGDNILYPLSLEKIARMYKCAIDNGFASFAEA